MKYIIFMRDSKNVAWKSDLEAETPSEAELKAVAYCEKTNYIYLDVWLREYAEDMGCDVSVLSSRPRFDAWMNLHFPLDAKKKEVKEAKPRRAPDHAPFYWTIPPLKPDDVMEQVRLFAKGG